MKTKKTIQLHSSVFMAISCFMITWQASAQDPTFSTGRTGTIYQGYVLNTNRAYHWTYFRLQSSNDRAWSIVNQGDLWWGYSPDDDFDDRGDEKMRLTTDGNLGIGTSTPRGKLDVDGSGDIYLVDDPNTNNAQSIYIPGHIYLAPHAGNTSYIQARRKNNSGSTELRFRTHNNGQLTEAMHINNQGSIGIGTTSPASLLHVKQTTDDSNGGLIIENSTYGRKLHLFADDNNDSRINSGGSGSGKLILNSGGGNVGIGTTTPETTLHIKGGDIRVDDGEYGSWGPVILHPDVNNSGDDIVKFVNSLGDENMRVHTNGNVGINTDNPTEKLEVSGTVKATSFVSSAASFPDYIFAADYKITPLSELEAYVKQHNRLPNMPSEKEVVEQGLNVSDVVVKSVENIETIYLHLIRMEKEIKALQQENTALKQQLEQGR